MANRELQSIELAEEKLLISYELQGETSVEEGLLSAFGALDFDLETRNPPLASFVNSDALNRLEWDNPHHEVHTQVWGHPVRILADRIEIFSTE
ncbi:hypothetical protein [Halospeciosus flavus]|uniref:Halobacterial output domain-containing protein n=1 Tax=Halospeciosus flavus TaxID=3032283 RepID=A0ABD5Z3S5_9EURY|nr:hypothetical protein [Halospeciosus flavus]